MKKIILTAAAVFAFGYANAQEVIVVEGTKGFSKGDMFVEGAIGISSGTTSENPGDAKSSYVFNPSIGYFITDKIALGIDMDISGTKFYGVNASGSEQKGTFGIGAFARYNFLQLGESKSFNAYGELGAGYSATRAELPNGDDNDAEKRNGVKASFSIGMNYFFTSHWAASFELANLISYNTQSQNGNNTDGLNVSIGQINNIFAASTFGILYKW